MKNKKRKISAKGEYGAPIIVKGGVYPVKNVKYFYTQLRYIINIM